MQILIVDQCSGDKRITPEETSDSLEEQPTLPARKMYTGRQQQYIDDAVTNLRNAGDEVDRYFISAKYGVISEDQPIEAYNATFKNMTSDEINHHSSDLEIQEDLVALLEDTEYDIVFLALGSDYYKALDLENLISYTSDETTIVLFNRGEMAEDNIVSIPARTEQAKEHGAIVVELKGVYIKNFSEHRLKNEIVREPDDVVEYCTQEPGYQADLGD